MASQAAAHGLGGASHASSLSAGQFYAQNMMMSSWRAYDGAGFQRTSPYGNYFVHFAWICLFQIVFEMSILLWFYDCLDDKVGGILFCLLIKQFFYLNQRLQV